MEERYLKCNDKANRSYLEALLKQQHQSKEHLRQYLTLIIKDEFIDDIIDRFEIVQQQELFIENYRIDIHVNSKVERPVKAKKDTIEVDQHVFIDSDSTCSIRTDYEYPTNKDLKFANVDVTVKGRRLLENANFSIVKGRVYGLIGRNGLGKTTILKAIRKRKIRGADLIVPRGLRIEIVKQEVVFDKQLTVLEFVTSNSRGDEETRNALVLLNLIGFRSDSIGGDTRMGQLSGGWKIRASLARALYKNPDLLLLDEPTNMLDIPTIIFLETKIMSLDCTMIIVSHDREFLNTVCTDILYLDELQVSSYRGNYDNFMTQREIEYKNNATEYKKNIADRQHLQEFIDRFRYNAKRASLVQSKIKILKTLPEVRLMKQRLLIEFRFECLPLKGQLIEFINVYFGYGGKNILNDVSLKIEDTTRIVLVGYNGTGKSTLLKLISGVIEPTKGDLLSHNAVRVGYFTQHHVDSLDFNCSVLNFVQNKSKQMNPSFDENMHEQFSRKALASFGLSVDHQRIGTLSGGQKSRLCFAILSIEKPNMLVLDEPTNHLDIESIEALTRCIRTFEGALICVSHDLKFVEEISADIWLLNESGEVSKFKGGIRDYKKSIQINNSRTN